MENNNIIENNDISKIVNNIKQPNTLLDEKFQKKVIKIFIEDTDFSNQVVDMLLAEYFDGIHANVLMKHILGYFHKYNAIPSYDTIQDIISDQEKDDTLRTHLTEFLTLTRDLKFADKQYVKDKTLNFCKKQSLKKGLLKAADAWEKENYEEIHKIITDSLSAGESKDAGHNYINDVEKRLLRDVRNPVGVLEGFNHQIAGGLAGGELGVVLAPTGGGKSMMLVKFGCQPLIEGKTVLYYSLELAERVIANRFDACLTGIKLAEILQFPQAIKEKVQEIHQMGGKLIIKEFPTGAASVQTIRSHIKILERDNIKPDIVFIDYADIMKPTENFKEKRFALTSIYESIRALAMELQIPFWTASQAGREALNESRFDLRVISESLGKAQTADVILGLGRSDEDKLARKAFLLVLKNRNGADGYSVELYFDTTNIDIYVQDQDKNVGLNGIVNGIEDQIRQNRTNPKNDFNANDNGFDENMLL